MTRITKREAIRRFNAGQTIILCPCKLRPGFPWSPHSVINIVNWGENANWELMYTNWAHYNTSYKAGYYAHYYVD